MIVLEVLLLLLVFVVLPLAIIWGFVCSVKDSIWND